MDVERLYGRSQCSLDVSIQFAVAVLIGEALSDALIAVFIRVLGFTLDDDFTICIEFDD